MSSSRRLASAITPSPPASATPSPKDSTISQITAGVIAGPGPGAAPAARGGGVRAAGTFAAMAASSDG